MSFHDSSCHQPFFGLFPGQGSQHVGMLKEFYDSFLIVRETFEEASDAISTSLTQLCFEGPESDLKLTENTQPCLLVASVAAFRVVQKEFGFLPQAVAGHSLGEYSALVCAGSLSLKRATQWVKKRGQAMQSAVPVSDGPMMAAILGLSDEQVQGLCNEATASAQKDLGPEQIVEPANFNSSGQVVIAGSVPAVRCVLQLLATDTKWKGGRAISLEVSAPFHCRLMKPARETMADLFLKAQEKPAHLAFPYVPNRIARLNSEPSTILELLIDQIDHPVLWKQSMETLLRRGGVNRAIEFGPGKVLAGLMKRISSAIHIPCETLSVHDMSSLKKVESFLSQSSPVL